MAMPRAVKWGLAGLGGVLLLAILALAGLTLALNAGALTPRLLAAIEQATGRAAGLGAVSLRPGLTPRLAVDGATLANLPGGSQPEMARIRRMEASLALLPLLRGEVAFRRIVIEGAEILLERTAQGVPNWVLRPAATDPAPGGVAGAPPPPRPARRVAIGEVVLADSRLMLPDPRLGAVAVERMRVTGLGSAGPLAFAGSLALHGVSLAVEGEASQTEPRARGTLTAGRNRIGFEGGIGAATRIEAAIPEPETLRPLLAGLAPGMGWPAALPPLEGRLDLAADMAPQAAALRIGAMDLGAVAPGLALSALSVAMPAPDREAEIALEGARGGVGFRAVLGLDPPAALLAPEGGAPLALALRAEAGAARLEATGRLARPRAGEGLALDIRASLPDAAVLAPLLPGLPALREASLSARVAMEGGPARGIAVSPFAIASPMLAAEGALTLTPGTPFGVTGRLAVARADLDALRPQAAPAAAPPAPPPAGPAPPAAERRLIPDMPLPLAAARAWRGRVEVSAGEIVSGGAAWRDLAAVIAARDGVLEVQPFALATPGGVLRGQARLDARAEPPAVALALRSEGRGLDLGALRRAMGEAPSLEGRAEIRLDLSGHGAGTRAVAATLAGEAGLAMVEGRLAPAGLARLGPELVALLLPGAPREGLALRCLALRLDAADGVARSRALLLETSAGRIEGTAALDLRDEGLAARLVPDVTLFGVTVRAPVGVGGTLAAPRVGVDAGRALGQAARDAAANRLGLDRGGPAGGDCAAQLRLARFGAEGPLPAAPAPAAAPAPVPGVPRELQGPAQDVLRGLGGILGGGRR
ncbi:AsmA protein [Roseomonas alkaliterrae]|uniref:AsmA protein n=2 Tax=Neoroseomonas alkaliterrae TaxID=1452450 RepID=A0A840XUP4_9PROT|nr:AsmA family protein [Neoroseomonas alkaliterrae]MBB5690780.1 AsmA protein [Neoroseomonas alkaliterrae]